MRTRVTRTSGVRAEEVKRGVWQAGGFPLEMPVLSVGETFMKPSPMLYRNLLAMEAEELLRANPIDGAVLLGGCDKTVPGLLMAAASANLPAIFLPAGPMLRGYWRGQTLASGSDVWKYWAEKRAGTIDDCAWREIEDGIARSFGTCMTMGTASTMATAAEAIGMTLPGAAATPAADSHHPRLAAATGRRIVEMVWEDLTPCEVMSTAAFENAVTAVVAVGGSTNAIIHLVAMARRAGASLDLDRFDALSRRTPLLGNIKPSGAYLMEDLYYAGGLPAVLERLRDLLALDALTVNGRTLGENIAGAGAYNDDVIAPRDAAAAGRRRAGGAPRQPGAGRRHHQVVGRRAEAAHAHGPGGGVSQLRRPGGAARRSRSGRDGGLGAGAAECRTAGRPRHAGVGDAADSEEAAAAGRARHGARVGCPHERHRVRRVRAPRVAGVVRRRAARAGARTAIRSS